MESATSLTSMWVPEGQLSPLKTQPSTPSKALGKDIVGEEVVNFYEEAGLDGIAREAKLIDPNTGSLLRDLHQQQVTRVVQLPPLISSKPSPMKTTTQILPKVATIVTTTNINAVPMILGTPQRQGSTILANSPQTQFVTTPIQIQSPSWSTSSQKRKTDFSDEYGDNGSSKRKKREKESKGLRHFSMKVCEKVQKKGVTSYNEVADELVREFSQPAHQFLPPSEQHQYDQKNIRRRVYDALNVLMAMNIISKEKKEIRWIGLPTNSRQECDKLETERKARLDRIRQKKSQLQELILQQIAFKNLVARNRRLEESGSSPPTSNSAIHLPYIIVNTSKKTVIDCSISNDKYEYLFNFNDTFQIHDDIEVLKRMGMAYGLEKGNCAPMDLERAKAMVPKALEPYLMEMATQSQSSTSTSIIAGPSGIQTQGTSRPHLPGDPQLSPLAVPLSHDAEVALATQDLAISQSSSLSSFSDAGPSRGATDTPSSMLESESDESSRESFQV